MNRKKFLNATFLVGLALYHLFFWKEKMGLNVLLFTAFISLALFYANTESFREKTVQVTAVGTLLLALMVVFVNSSLSKVVYSFSLVAFAGFVHQKSLRFIGYALCSKFLNFFLVPVTLKNNFNRRILTEEKANNFVYYFKLLLLPLLIFIIFFTIYSTANPQFLQLSETYWNWLDRFFFSGPSFISFSWIIFIAFAACVLAMLFLDPRRSFFTQRQEAQCEDLTRTKKVKGRPFSMVALKNEHLTALITFGSLNALLLLVNLLDISHVWFNFQPLSPYELSQFVHSGTYLLIFSILLAMGLTLYFFRNNLNFFPNNTALKLAAYAWIGQNMLLATSLGVRNFYYMNQYGLAYKRIGVVIFLILVFAGLLTMWTKVKERKTGYFLFHRNGWILYGVMVVAACINWDTMITKHNLGQHPGKIDSHFLLYEMTNKNLHLLIDYNEKHKATHGKDFFPYAIHANRFELLNEQSHFSFFSWNYPDYKNVRYLQEKGLDNMNH